jgi:hypothetical protein
MKRISNSIWAGISQQVEFLLSYSIEHRAMELLIKANTSDQFNDDEDDDDHDDDNNVYDTNPISVMTNRFQQQMSLTHVS